MAVTFEQLMNGFGVVTVMNACIYKLKEGHSYVGRGACQHAGTSGGALKPGDFYCTGLYLDTLKIANFTQEGPTKTVTGGQYANPLIKYGKTMTLEMQDALGRAATMVEFFGCAYDQKRGRLSITDKFPGAFAIEGDTFFIDQDTGEKVNVHILIPQFLPDAILTLTQDAEGDAAVFDLNGTVGVTDIVDADGVEETSKPVSGTERSIFIEINEDRWFEGVKMAKTDGSESNYHTTTESEEKAKINRLVNQGEELIASLGYKREDFKTQLDALEAATGITIEEKYKALIKAINDKANPSE